MSERAYLCVYCGSSIGARPIYVESARKIGEAIAKLGLGLVYGGGQVGLMGVVADAVLAGGCPVLGVIPEPLAREEIAHQAVTELLVVPDMHRRKAIMAERASGFLTLPGGIGTFEEFFEILTWGALGLHRKPIGLLNVAGYFDPLLAFLEHAATERFVRRGHLDLILTSDDPESLPAALLHRVPPDSGPLLAELDYRPPPDVSVPERDR